MNRIDDIRALLAAPIEQTVEGNTARGWRSDCEYLMAKVDELRADLKKCAPHVRSWALSCEACEGSGEILEPDDGARRCEHCQPVWELEERINPKEVTETVHEELDDDIAF